MAIIEFEDVKFSYDGKRDALAGTTFGIEPGEYACVLGGNGSGKSTLAKHVNALLAPDAGKVRVMGLDTSAPENVFTVRSNAGMVFQNPDDQIVASVIENDVAFGPENLGVPAPELRERVTEALAQVGLQGFEKKQTETLSGGQKQRVAVAGALAMHPRILVLDEASAMLDPRGRAALARVCRELNDAGLTIVVITHFMEEAAHADRVLVLDSGKVALSGTPEEVFLRADELERLALDVPFATQLSLALRGVGIDVGMHAREDDLERELMALLGADNADTAKSETEDGTRAFPCASEEAGAGASPTPPDDASPQAAAPSPAENVAADSGYALAFDKVSFTYEAVSQERKRRSSVAPDGKQADWGRSPSEYWALRSLTFEVRKGEFFGIAGHTGSGKSTLIQLANGLLKPTQGTVSVEGRALSDKSAAAEARRGVGVVFQYPEHQLFAASVYEDVAFGPRNLGLSAGEVEERVSRAMDMVHLDLDELRDVSPFALSGGQQRRVAFAGVLAMSPHTLVLDEPVAGLDPRAKRRFLELLAELHDEQGLTIVTVSHNMDDLATLCDRILVLNEGQLFAVGTPAEVFADEERLRGVGLGVPHAAHLANRLAGAGVKLPVTGVPTTGELARAIASQVRG